MNALTTALVNLSATLDGTLADDAAITAMAMDAAHGEALAVALDNEPRVAVKSHWESHGEGVYSFGLIRSWYDDYEPTRCPSGWVILREVNEGPDEWCKHHEAIYRVYITPA